MNCYKEVPRWKWNSFIQLKRSCDCSIFRWERTLEKRKNFEKLSCKVYLVSVDDKFYRRHIDQIKRSYSVARGFRNSDLWDTVKTSVDKRNIKPNENEVTMINIHNKIGDPSNAFWSRWMDLKWKKGKCYIID